MLGTDGFGRSDYRVALRRFFEVDRHHVAVAALKALADEGAVEPAVVQRRSSATGSTPTPRRRGRDERSPRRSARPLPRAPRGEALFVMPNPWDVGSARLLEAPGFEALATTSQGFAWSIGKRDHHGDARRARRARRRSRGGDRRAAERRQRALFPDDPGGVAETVRLLVEAGAAGCSIEDYDPATGAIEDVGLAAERVAEAAEARTRGRPRSSSRGGRRTTCAASTTSTTRSPASSRTATRAPTASMRRASPSSTRSRRSSRRSAPR